MSVKINFEFLPTIFIENNNWVLEEEDNLIKVELSEGQLKQLLSEYTWVELVEIPYNLRYRINKSNTFYWEGKPWVVISKEELEEITDLSNKVEFYWNYLPKELKIQGTWDPIELQGEWVVYLTQEEYNIIKRTYKWVKLEVIPETQRVKIEVGNIIDIGGEWVAILSRSVISTIFRKHQARG